MDSHDAYQLKMMERVEGLTFPLISGIARKVMPKQSDCFQQWFDAVEQVGDHVGIRFGFIAPGRKDPEWKFLSHAKVDGIGGFAEVLRSNGAHLPELPRIKLSSPVSGRALLRYWPKYLAPRTSLNWTLPNQTKADGVPVPQACSWHLFDEKQTSQIRRVCWQLGITVNSFLVHHLTHAVRPDLEKPNAVVPWLIPVNMRGGVKRERDTDNHSSYVSIRVFPTDPIHQTHQQILDKIEKGEHWANWYAYQLGRCATAGIRQLLVAKELCFAQWNLGAFSNLGNWDPDKRLSGSGIVGDWLFCPPVLKTQKMAAGCVTFQGRLSLMTQAHAMLTTDVNVTNGWIQNWVQSIETNLRNIVGEEKGAPRLSIVNPLAA
ncbi:MAG: hypothetical protein JWM16_4737 [Verrucomicrobiales bacterium]|nr:hypothetical protein [Verrucomicrobiales bacterium]